MINPIYSADKARYSGGMKYRRCGKKRYTVAGSFSGPLA